MKKIVLLLQFLFINIVIYANVSSGDSMIRIVDQVINTKDAYQQTKLSNLIKIRHKAESLQKGPKRFQTLSNLMGEYMYYSTDSAFNVLIEMEDLASYLGDNTLKEQAKMNRANLMTQVAMYPEALELLSSLNKKFLPDSLLSSYYNINRTLYGRLSDYSVYPSEKEKYDKLTAIYLDSLINANEKGSLNYTLALADKLNMTGNPLEAIKEINEYIESNTVTEHENAILYWTRSESYKLLGDKEARKDDIIRSAISDIKSGIREYISLRELAFLLDEEGDNERAYKYVTTAMQDAEACNARQRIIELNSRYPLINEIYFEKIDYQKKTLGWFIGIVSFLSVILFGLSIFLKKEIKIVKQSRSKMQLAYEELDEANAKLNDYNKQLIIANKDIAEYSKLKEVYISKYMDQCMVYIDKIDSFRKTALNLLNLNKINELKKIVKSTADINEQLKSFYQQFDKTFLSLFPNFVEQVNALFSEEEKIETKDEESLTPELRILALIRLGIVDSEKISKFLHYSLTTIYSYRTRLRNKAKGDRNLFEEQIKNITRDI